MSVSNFLALQLPGADIPDGLAIPEPGFPIFGTITPGGDSDTFTLTLTKPVGVAFETAFRIFGIGETPLVDPRITVTSSDPNLVSTVVMPSFAEASGQMVGGTTYTLQIDSAGLQLGGDFMLVVGLQEPGLDTFNAYEAAWQLVQGHATWSNANLGTNIQPWRSWDLSSGQLTYDISGLDAEMAVMAVTALQMWNDILGLTLVEVTGGADIRFTDDTFGLRGTTTLGLSSDGKTIQSAHIDVPQSPLLIYGSGLDSPAYEAFLHEIGHALGLGHLGNYAESFNAGTAYFDNDTPQLSVMTRREAVNDHFASSNGFNPEYLVYMRYMLTPMLGDVTAMQFLYGRPLTVRPGDTTYGYNSNTGNTVLDQIVTLNRLGNFAFAGFTVVDGGGVDTLDFSGSFVPQVISLIPGTVSNVLGGLRNMNVAIGTWIEHAKGGEGDDLLLGNDLGNRLEGGAGSDTLQGRLGDDTLEGGAGRDRLQGGEGNDLLLSDAAGGFDDLYGGEGWDRAEILAEGDLVLDLLHGALKPAGQRFALRSVEEVAILGSGAVRVLGSEGDDRVETGAGATRFDGRGGHDWIAAGAGADTLFGGAGNDTLDGGSGADHMDGGTGDDLYLVDDAGDRVLDSSTEAGLDRVVTSVDFRLAALARIEELAARDATSTQGLALTGNGWSQSITGAAGDDVLRGGGGSDRIFGLEGDDTLIGDGWLEGGAGDDLYRVSDAGTVIVETAGQGRDTVISAVSLALDAAAEVEVLRLAGPDAVTGRSLTGNGFAQWIWGDAGGNLLDGGGGADRIFGGDGNDTLIGAGARLAGGAGADVFVLRDAASTLVDFDAAEDMIHIDLGLGGLTPLGALRVNLTGLAETGDDRVIYDSTSGALWYDADGNGAGGAERLATLLGAPQDLTAAQILLL